MDRDRTLSQARAEEHEWGRCPICDVKTASPGEYCSVECYEDSLLDQHWADWTEREKEAKP